MKKKKLTKQDILEMFAASDARFAQQMAESKIEAEKRHADFEADLKKSREKADKEMRGLRQELGSFGRTQGELAERYFQKAIQRNMKLLHVDLQEMETNVNKYSKALDIREEYDMILTNSDIIVVVEVKHKLRVEDVEKFYSKKIPNFRKLFPDRKDYQIVGAVAAFLFDKNSQELAENYGFLILTKTGKELEILNSKYNIF